MLGIRLFAAMLVVLVVCGTGIAFAAEGTSTPDESSLSAAPEESEGVELPSKRTATSDTYRLPGGELETQLYESPVNYRDDEGDWKPIEEGLEYEGGTLTNGANSFDLSLPSKMGAGAVRLSEAGQWVSYKLLGEETQPAELEEEGIATYETPSGQAFDLSGLANGVKEQIELTDSSQPSSFRFELAASSGLTPQIEEDGSLAFRDSEDKAFASLPAPTVVDSSPEAVPSSGAVGYALQERPGGGWILTLEVNHEWLSSPDRNWPVEIDPTLTVESPTLDCTFGSLPSPEGWSGCGSTGRQNLLAAYSQKENQPSRSLLRFNVSSIPSGDEVTEAIISLDSPTAAENTSAVQIRRATKLWTSTLNWHLYDNESNKPGGGTYPWTTPGGDYTSEGAEILTSQRGSGAGWWNFYSPELTQVVQNWVSGKTSNQGLLVKNSNESKSECEANPEHCNRRYVEFNSSAVADTHARPKIAVTYFPSAPSTSKVTSPTEGTVTARRLKLKAGWSESTPASSITFQYRLARSENQLGEALAFKTIPPELIRNAKGGSVSWPLAVTGNQSEPLYFDAAHADPTLQKQGGQIEVRALFESSTPGAAGYSVPAKATVSRFKGGPGDGSAAVGPGSVDLLTGNYTMARTDVSIPAFGSALEFARTWSSSEAKPTGGENQPSLGGVLGPGWSPSAPVEAAGGSEWQGIKEVLPNAKEIEEYEEYEEPVPPGYVLLTDLEGGEYAFEISGSGFVVPPEATGWILKREGSNGIALTDSAGNRTLFEKQEGTAEYKPVSVTQTGANQTKMVWKFVNGNRRLEMVIAPTPSGVEECNESNATAHLGCKALKFTYQKFEGGGKTWERLTSIAYYGPASASSMGSWEVADYTYNSEGRLIEEWDPRITPNLKETYAYRSDGQMTTLTPPGEEPWSFEYYESYDGENPHGRLRSVKRASLLSEPTTAQTTIVYGVPLSGAEAPYEMSGSAVAQWGQQDIPVDATAIFPPDQVPGSPPSSYSRATVDYTDAEGRLVNTATPSGAGTSAPSITTSEYDEYGNLIRELSAQNRLRALAAGSESEKVAKSHELETKRVYNSEGAEKGTEMLEELGPMHQVRLESGEVVQARTHKTVEYDFEEPAPPSGTPYAHLPTREIVGASIVGRSPDADRRVIETSYNWTLRKPTDTIVDSNGLDLHTHIEYDSTSGLPTETRLPANPEGGDAHTTKTIYYKATGSGTCEGNPAWANLPCEIVPAGQPGTSGQPALLDKQIVAYSPLSQPTEVIESAGEINRPAGRITHITYDAAGRELSKSQSGGGTALHGTETTYNTANGKPEAQRFACESQCGGGTPSYSSAFGASGTGNGKFAHPAGIAIDSAGNLWVVDENNHRLEKFNAAGEFIKAFGSSGSGNGQFGRPTDVAIDAKGNLWVTDASNNRVEEFNEKGEYVSKFGSLGSGNGQFNGPEGIAIDAKGNIWVADTYNARLQEFNEKGEFIRVVGSKGTGQGQLVEPTGIAIGPQGNVWVADWANNRVEEFSESGSFVRQFGTEGTGNGQFKRPDVIEVESGGNVLVGDQNNERIQEFNQSGEYVTKFGSAGSGAGQFSFGYPMGIAADGKGDVWVSDTGNNRVEKWVSSSTFDNQETKTTYDALGRVKEYQDADGNIAKTTYDLDGRPVSTSDNKGTQTRTYDATSGLLVKLEDSAAGTFTAAYDADGNMVEEGLPDGLLAKTTYDPAGQATNLSYEKKTFCSTSCTWLEYGLERSITGQILRETSLTMTHQYGYDKAGRLTLAEETPKGGGCTTRSYSFDKDSNRTALVTRAPGIGGVCDTSSKGTEQIYKYDAGDRLETPSSIVYDNFGRITSLPAEDAGGSTLTTSYYSNNMVASQSQGGISNSYQLDATGRQRERVQTGGSEPGTEIYHYDGGSDAPAWTERRLWLDPQHHRHRRQPCGGPGQRQRDDLGALRSTRRHRGHRQPQLRSDQTAGNFRIRRVRESQISVCSSLWMAWRQTAPDGTAVRNYSDGCSKLCPGDRSLHLN